MGELALQEPLLQAVDIDNEVSSQQETLHVHLEGEREQEAQTTEANETEHFFTGTVQPPVYHDVGFAVIFLLMLVWVTGCAALVGDWDWIETSMNATNTTGVEVTLAKGIDMVIDLEGILVWQVVFFLGVVLVSTLVSTSTVLWLLQHYTLPVVHLSFLAWPLVVLVTTISLLTKNMDDMGTLMLVLVIAFVLLAWLALRYYAARSFLPYTAANLQVALQAIPRSLWIVAVTGQLLACVYTLLWYAALMGVLPYFTQTGIVVLFVIPLYWTTTVVWNLVRTTTAGTVAAWWFGAERSETYESLVRASTYGLGSICFGSLLVALAQVAEVLVAWTRRSRHRMQEDSLLLCCAECALRLLKEIVEYFSAWAFLYVGIYGYSYIEAGKNVTRIFQQRGWAFLWTDRWMHLVLAVCRWTTAFGTALLTIVILGAAAGWKNVDGDGALFTGIMAMAFSLWITSSSFFVVESAVRTIILCFTERPSDGASHHPVAVDMLVEGWSKSYSDWRPLMIPVDGELA